ncbi:BON domain-containing protein [Methylocella tundrae]|uniref:BON domain-containing protein n=1 Tax=Methylocella tundrae TaxID=227605 RepID=UPI003BF785F3
MEVAFTNLEVTLTGTAENRDQRRRAEMVAERVVGVLRVQNNLRVKSASEGSAQRVHDGSSGPSQRDPPS